MDIDVDVFSKHMNNEEPLVFILKGHAYVEATLKDLVASSFLDPQPLELARLGFARVVDLAVAQGLIDEGTRATLMALADLRNQLAHRVDVAFTPDLERDFLNVLRQQLDMGPEWRLDRQALPHRVPWDDMRIGVAVVLKQLRGQRRRVKERSADLKAFHDFLSARHDRRSPEA